MSVKGNTTNTRTDNNRRTFKHIRDQLNAHEGVTAEIVERTFTVNGVDETIEIVEAAVNPDQAEFAKTIADETDGFVFASPTDLYGEESAWLTADECRRACHDMTDQTRSVGIVPMIQDTTPF